MSATHGAYLMLHLGGVRVVLLEILEFQEGTLRFLALYGGVEVCGWVLILYGLCQMTRNLVFSVVRRQCVWIRGGTNYTVRVKDFDFPFLCC